MSIDIRSLNGIDKEVYFNPIEDMINVNSFTPAYKIGNEVRFFYDEEAFPRVSDRINNDKKYDDIIGNGVVLEQGYEVLSPLREVDGKFPYRVEVANVINDYQIITYFLDSYLSKVFTTSTTNLFTHKNQIVKIRDLCNNALVFLDNVGGLYYYGIDDRFNIAKDIHRSGIPVQIASDVKDFWNTKCTVLYQTTEDKYYGIGDLSQNEFIFAMNYNNANTEYSLMRFPFNKDIKQIMSTSNGYGILLQDGTFYMTGPDTMLTEAINIIRAVDTDVNQLICTNGIDIVYVKNEDFTNPEHVGLLYVSNAKVISNYFYSEVRGDPYISSK